MLTEGRILDTNGFSTPERLCKIARPSREVRATGGLSASWCRRKRSPSALKTGTGTMDATTKPKRKAGAAASSAKPSYPDLHDHVRALEKAGQLIRVDRPITQHT